MWLALGLRCALGGRNEHRDSLAVDIGAHFQRSKASDSSRWHAGESDVIERLGHEIAQQLAGMGRHHHRTGTDAISSDAVEPDSSDDVEEAPSISQSVASGLLERVEHDSPATRSSPVVDLGTVQRSAADSILQKLQNISKVLDTTSTFEKSSGTLVHMATGESKNTTPAIRSLEEAKTLMVNNKSKHHQQGLDGVAGDLLQLEEAVVREQMHHSGIDKVPSFDFLDKEHVGSITLDQFKSFCSSMVGDPDALFHKIDVDSSGTFDKQEYKHAVNNKVIKPTDFKPEILAAAAGVDSAANQQSRSSVFVLLVSLFFLWKPA